MKKLNTPKRVKKLFHLDPDKAEFVRATSFARRISQSDIVNQAISLLRKTGGKGAHDVR